MISNCGKDERGQYSGGQAGDQTGSEYRIIGWFNRPWNCVLRHPDSKVRSEIALLATQAAQNDKIGYDQKERLTFWNELAKVGFSPAAINVPCEADCSSSTAAIVKAVGFRLGIDKLKAVSEKLATYSMRSAFQNAGFDVLTESKYLTSANYLLAGDILLNDSAHAAINITNGNNADVGYGNTTTPDTPSNSPNSPVLQDSPTTGITTTPEVENVIQGVLVDFKEGAVYWSGASIPAWVKRLRWYVASVNGERAVLGESEDGKYNIRSPINVKYLHVVSKPTEEKPEEPEQETSTGDGYEPIVCMMTQSTCYRQTTKMEIKGVLWHSTGANNPWLKRYVQPDDNAPDKPKMLALLGTNAYRNDWNHQALQAGLNAWVGKLADGSVIAVQTMPWNFKPWGCGSGSKGSCNQGWIQFEICEDALTDRSYFESVYEEAVKLTAYLCRKFGIDPHGTVGNIPTILCHQDSYRLGMGSNHSDVYHWFNRYGKTMDNVRNDVAKILGTSERDLGKGDKGADVEQLQKNLISLGYKLPQYGPDGDFGNETEGAVQEFQKDNGLKIDGIAGKLTKAAIAKLLK